MNSIKIVLGVVILSILTGCASTIRTTHTSSYQATPANIPIVVYGLNETPPANAKNIGTIKIGDSGFSVDCGWNKVLEKAKYESRKIGGNAIKLVTVYESG